MSFLYHTIQKCKPYYLYTLSPLYYLYSTYLYVSKYLLLVFSSHWKAGMFVFFPADFSESTYDTAWHTVNNIYLPKKSMSLIFALYENLWESKPGTDHI